MLPEETRFRLATERAAAKVIDGDAIVIDTVSGRYYSLEGTGEAAWSLLTASFSLREVADSYETGEADVLADVSRLAEELVAERLIEEAPEAPAGEPPQPGAGPRPPYTAPAVTIFRDMEDMLAFDPPLPQAAGVWTPKPHEQ
jgi:hypothetical protein